MLCHLPAAVEPVACAGAAANRLPRDLADRAYALAGWSETSAPACPRPRRR
ncbi:hypothetical protein [Nonomuraea diastatica]|uniref:hypothetical protein n=1 Tax=Nonomuraea diastatica TaxID=1848329 RepID=UPI0014075501|nr:hypothetical protein [Nonomuraea diastatica]